MKEAINTGVQEVTVLGDMAGKALPPIARKVERGFHLSAQRGKNMRNWRTMLEDPRMHGCRIWSLHRWKTTNDALSESHIAQQIRRLTLPIAPKVRQTIEALLRCARMTIRRDPAHLLASRTTHSDVERM